MKVNTILLVLECILFLFFVDNSTSTREIPITNETNLAALNVKPIVDHWQLYIRYGDPSNPLYVNNSAAELMSICGGLSGCDKLKLALNSTVVKEKICSRKNCIDPCTVKRLYNLCVAQVQVKNYQTVIEKKIRWIILLICQVLTCLAGFFLFVTGHFKFQNLPLIGNELLDRPTGGVNYFHFMWMRWIILGNTNTHWKTHLKPDSYIFDWVPLARCEWSPPVIKRKDLEPQEEDNPFWNVELLKDQMKDRDAIAQVQEYYNRIYSWAWVRYRGKGSKRQREMDYELNNLPKNVKPRFITFSRANQIPRKKYKGYYKTRETFYY